MKKTLSLALFPLLLLGAGHAAWSQQVYRCAGVGGSAPEYINNVKDAQNRNCQLISGGNVTVVQTMPTSRVTVRAPTTVRDSSVPRSASSSPRLAEGSSPEQRARDSDSRGILEAELRKSEAKLAELEKEYNKGEPEKQGIEGRNYQRYLDRVNELKENITRSQSDIAGLKRELSRLPASN
ncbi:MAG: hypothetical protein M3R45_02990 [Pseudomonadota bacterium]|nr:hypothetical protein [Pseudomonadota bacterium]